MPRIALDDSIEQRRHPIVRVADRAQEVHVAGERAAGKGGARGQIRLWPDSRFRLQALLDLGGPGGRRNLEASTVLERVLGRTRNIFRFIDGTSTWPVLLSRDFQAFVPNRQFQVVQTSRERLEVRLAAERALTAVEEAKLGELIRARLGHRGFEFDFSYHAHIPRSAGGKYEDFKSEL